MSLGRYLRALLFGFQTALLSRCMRVIELAFSFNARLQLAPNSKFKDAVTIVKRDGKPSFGSTNEAIFDVPSESSQIIKSFWTCV